MLREDKRPTKYIFVTGGVVSSLGKGLAAASIGRILEARGFRVALQKLDGGVYQRLRLLYACPSIIRFEERHFGIVAIFAVFFDLAQRTAEFGVELARLDEVEPEERDGPRVRSWLESDHEQQRMGGVIRCIVGARDGVVPVLRRQQPLRRS